MAIPATSAPSERVFSVAGNLITKKRTKILSENVRYVLCLRSWGILANTDNKEVILVNTVGLAQTRSKISTPPPHPYEIDSIT
jgi:hypothetical protein